VPARRDFPGLAVRAWAVAAASGTVSLLPQNAFRMFTGSGGLRLRFHTRIWLGFAGLSLALVVMHVRADVVGPPPTKCPDGTTPEESHAGPYCRMNDCPDAGPCPDGTACQSRYLCVEVLRGGTIDGVTTVHNVVDVCPDASSCEVGACELHEVCMPAVGVRPSEGADGPREDSGCGCRAAPARPSMVHAWSLVLLAACLCARRRVKTVATRMPSCVGMPTAVGGVRKTSWWRVHDD
jgi:hypothetical protein